MVFPFQECSINYFNQLFFLQKIGKDVSLEPCVEIPIGRDQKKAWVTPQCLKGFHFKSVLGSGTSGTVFDSHARVDRNHHMEVAMKTQFASKEFEKECDILKTMSESGVCPQFIDAWIEEGVGFLATEKWDISLWEWIQNNNLRHTQKGYPLPKKLISKLSHLIERMHKKGYVHGDIMEKNIMLRLNSKGLPVDICLTDFGLTIEKDDWKNHLDFLKVLYDYHMSSCNYTDRYFKEKGLNFADVAIDPCHLDKALVYYMKTRSPRGD